MSKRLIVNARFLSDGKAFSVYGRDAWALLQLVAAGPNGCTPIDNPGPRWSGYVFNLKRKHGLDIVTHLEAHRGSFPGIHARYELISELEIIGSSESPKQEAA